MEVPPRFETIADEVEFGRRWQAELAADRWVGIHWPDEYGGRARVAGPGRDLQHGVRAVTRRSSRSTGSASTSRARRCSRTAPTSRSSGGCPAILTADEIWCQLFREPDAGSDLASLQTRAVRVDDGWLLSGQKVWTSYAQFARWGICLARTDPDAPKHKGISYLVVDMQAPGIEVRPLVQITGDAEFNEVFFDEVFVPDDHLVGGAAQRVGGRQHHARARARHRVPVQGTGRARGVPRRALAARGRAAAARRRRDRRRRSRSRSSSCACCACTTGARCRGSTKGIEPGPESSITKLAWTDMTQALSARALDVVGAAAPLWWGADDNPGGGFWQRQWLWSKAASIAGGTSEVQRTIIGDRMLGLPR